MLGSGNGGGNVGSVKNNGISMRKVMVVEFVQ